MPLEWLGHRLRVFEAAGFKCQKCGTPAPKPGKAWCGLDIHHVGSERDHENVEVLCEPCHYAPTNHRGACHFCGGLVSRSTYGAHAHACLLRRMSEGYSREALEPLIAKFGDEILRGWLIRDLRLGVAGLRREAQERQRRRKALKKRLKRYG